ncbi:hypothetical protein [Jannaschia sp. W003]|uniref:hypothetical protein n=1 Tax=Jannaschia sp. W003 TaxID=2867012 RepID=UPI0021A54502|nr:hypothetical protein [Jannaschia sp. W003]UWQ20334.1 hypothetical protein K3554_10030 [Jannaschia sp. W003]
MFSIEMHRVTAALAVAASSDDATPPVPPMPAHAGARPVAPAAAPRPICDHFVF